MMRKLFFLIVFITVTHTGMSYGAVKIDVDSMHGYVEGALMSASSIDNVFYGAGGTGSMTITKWDTSYDIDTAGQYSFPSTGILDIWPTSTSGKIFILWKDTADDTYNVYLSNDGGATLANSGSPVVELGYDPTNGHVPNVWALHRGFAEGEVDGVTTYFIGEYNSAPGRVAGGANDCVRLLSSTDGVTWSQEVQFNQDGANRNVLHIHAVRYDSGYIYIAFGDGGTANKEAGIIRWNPSTGVWSDNQDISYFSSVDGFKSVSGSQTYRVVDLIFTDNHIFSMSDNYSDNSTRGIWQCNKDLTGWTLKNNDIVSYDNHCGWMGLKTTSGTLLFIDQIAAGATDYQINMWSSGDNGETWALVGKIGCNSLSGIQATINMLEEFNGNIVVGPTYYGAGKSSVGRDKAILTEQGTFAEIRPVILHPVFWVSPSGSNSDDGWTPSTAWATPKHALEGDRLSPGSRLIIASGSYPETTRINIDWDTPDAAYETTGSVVIEGAGLENTTLYQTAAGSNTEAIILYADEGEVIFKDLQIYNARTSRDIYLYGGTAIFDQCLIGGKAVHSSGTVCVMNHSGDLTITKSRIESGADNGSGLIYFLGTTPSVDILSSVISGGRYGIYYDVSGSSLSIKHSAILDYSQRGISAAGGADQQMTVKYNAFDGGASSYPIYDASGITETDVDYNFYDESNLNLTDGGNSISGADPGIDSDYELDSSSVLINALPYAGRIGGVGWFLDFNDNKYYFAPLDKMNIGHIQMHSDGQTKAATRNAASTQY